MATYIVWYKKNINAANIKQAVLKEKKVKALFHSIVEEEEPKVEQGASAIGFETFSDEEDWQ